MYLNTMNYFLISFYLDNGIHEFVTPLLRQASESSISLIPAEKSEMKGASVSTCSINPSQPKR